MTDLDLLTTEERDQADTCADEEDSCLLAERLQESRGRTREIGQSRDSALKALALIEDRVLKYTILYPPGEDLGRGKHVTRMGVREVRRLGRMEGIRELTSEIRGLLRNWDRLGVEDGELERMLGER